MCIKKFTFFVISHMSVNDCKHAMSIDLQLQINFSDLGAFVNMKSINNEDKLYVYMCVCLYAYIYTLLAI